MAKRTKADMPPSAKWVYDHPSFFIMNLAVGGAWSGNPDATTPFPQRMLVDNVQVYKAALPSDVVRAVVKAERP